MTTQVSEAIEWNVSAEAYHADTSKIGHSMFEEFIKSQRKYRDLFVTKAKPLPAPSEALELGIWTHLAVLEPDRWASEYCFDLPAMASDGEAWNWRKPSHRAERDALKGDRPKLLTMEQRSLVESMRDAVMENGDARTLIELPGIVEQGYYWQDECGLFLKSRPDKIIGDVLPDLKTCIDASPEGFTAACMRQGYHRTAAWRIDGHRAMTGRDARYLFIAVSKETLDVGVHELSPAEIELGRAENRRYLNRLAECYATGDWQAAWSKQVMVLTYPAWRFRSDEWEVE